MREKIERSRDNARRALDAYRLGGAVDPDDSAAIGDLIVDLLHLAAADDPGAGDELGPEHLAYRALDEYSYESDPANANEHV